MYVLVAQYNSSRSLSDYMILEGYINDNHTLFQGKVVKCSECNLNVKERYKEGCHIFVLPKYCTYILGDDINNMKNINIPTILTEEQYLNTIKTLTDAFLDKMPVRVRY